MRYRYRFIGFVVGTAAGLLIGGRDLVLCAATWVFAVPLGAAIGYFVDSATDDVFRWRMRNIQRAPRTDGGPDCHPCSLGPRGQEVDGLGFYIEDLDTRRSPVDIRIV